MPLKSEGLSAAALKIVRLLSLWKWPWFCSVLAALLRVEGFNHFSSREFPPRPREQNWSSAEGTQCSQAASLTLLVWPAACPLWVPVSGALGPASCGRAGVLPVCLVQELFQFIEGASVFPSEFEVISSLCLRSEKWAMGNTCLSELLWRWTEVISMKFSQQHSV